MNKHAHPRRSRIYIMILALILVLVSGKTPVFAETVNVGSFDELQRAITDGKTDITINLTQDIDVTETLVIDKDVKISGENQFTLKWAPTDRSDQKGDQMFKVNEGKTLALGKITLDGDNQGRLINVKGGTVNLENVILQNGSTEKLEQNAKGDQNFSGGAILATKGEKQGSTVTITGGKFLNNNTGAVRTDEEEKNYRYRAAEGGAIKIEDSILTINNADTTDKATTTFEGNHLDHWQTGGGRQGGSIEATRSQVEIYGATFDVPGPFNTGGAIKFENCGSGTEQAKVINSSFTILDGKKPVGMAGGAITSEGSYLTIDKSTFKTGKGSYVQESGGLIQVVGTGEFHLTNSELTGSGVGWNATAANKTAKYGGAIVFYDDSTVTATIENSTIRDFTAEISGGGIALNTQVGNSGGTNLTLKDTKILNNLAYAYNMTAYGGGIFVGKGNTVTMEGGQISSEQSSSVGGGIYNEGKLTLTGTAEKPAKIINNKAYHMAAGVLNDGELTVDYATFSGNAKGDWSNSNQHVYNKDEMAGENIYAVKDVTITKNAQFDGKDVRILDGQSSIILTGKLPEGRHINVSISETPKSHNKTVEELKKLPLHPKFAESMQRKVGYLVAVGNGTYQPTAEDAKKIHYVSKDTDPNQPRAEATDHESTGKWDFVLSPQNQVVLGQRAELIFDGNGGTFNGEVTDTKNYTFYSSEDPFADKTDMKAEKTPTMDGYQFVGWAEDKKAAFESADDYLNSSVTKFNDSKSYMSLQAKQTGPITDILKPHTKTVYALWVKQIDIPVNKVWGEGTKDEQKQAVELTLTGVKTPALLTLNETNQWNGKFEKVDTIAVAGEDGKDAKITNYSVSEASIPGFDSKTTGNATDGFTVTNTPIEETVDISVSKAWQDENGKDATPTGVTATIKLLADGVDTNKTLTFTGNGTQKFEKLPKKNEQGADIVYTISEETVAGYEKGVVTGNATDGFTVTNKKAKPTPPTPEEKVSIQVTKVWSGAAESDKAPVTITLKANGEATNKTVTLSADNQWAATFEGLAEKDENGKITYTVTENNVQGFTSKVTGDAANGFTVTNIKDKPTPEQPSEMIITRYVDGSDKDLISPKDGKHDKETIRGYEFIETKVTTEKTTDGSKTIIRHIYKKVPEDNRNTGGYIVWKNEPVSDDGLLNKKDHKAYMFGYPDGNFLPDRNMTREEVTAMFARLLKDYPRERRSYAIPYKDVTERDWSYEAIGFMTEKGIIKGYEDGSFRPKEAISRAEFAAMAARFDKLVAGTGNPFNDVPDTHWAVASIDSAAAKGWVSGYPDGSFKPERKITRSEVVSITNIMLDRYADKDFVRDHLPEMIPFYDLTEANWAYFPIMEATHGHDYTRKAPQEENWIRLNGEEFRFPLLYRK